MPGDDDIKFGILKCRDLVQLYYGARMVTSIIENETQMDGANFIPILLQDPRRIRYEIIIENQDAATAHEVQIGTPPTFNLGTAQVYFVPPHSTQVIERSFLTDMDAVCLALSAFGVAQINISTRETFLTPAPVDEIS